MYNISKIFSHVFSNTVAVMDHVIRQTKPQGCSPASQACWKATALSLHTYNATMFPLYASVRVSPIFRKSFKC